MTTSNQSLFYVRWTGGRWGGRGGGGGGGGVPLSASCVVTYFILMVTLCSKYYYSLIDEVNETQGGQTDKKWHSQNLSPAFWFGTCYL